MFRPLLIGDRRGRAGVGGFEGRPRQLGGSVFFLLVFLFLFLFGHAAGNVQIPVCSTSILVRSDCSLRVPSLVWVSAVEFEWLHRSQDRKAPCVACSARTPPHPHYHGRNIHLKILRSGLRGVLLLPMVRCLPRSNLAKGTQR